MTDLRPRTLPVLLPFIAAALIASLRPAIGDATQPAGSAPRAIEINGTTLHYVEAGSGDPVVFVHGSLGDYRTFQRQFEALSSAFRVFAYSRRYHPPNPIPPAAPPYSLQTHVDDLAAFVEALEIGPAHFVGNSYGAYVSLALAVQHPEKVQGLVLGEPPVVNLLEASSVGKALRQSFDRNTLEPARAAFRAGNSGEGVRRFVDGVLGEGTFEGLPSDVQKGLLAFGPEMNLELEAESDSYMPPLSCDALGKLDRPVLLLTGERSAPMFHVMTLELERCLEGEAHVMVPAAGHGMHSANPVFYTDSVKAFLRR